MKTRFLRKRDEENVLIATPTLLKRNDMYECDATGRLLSDYSVNPSGVGASIEELPQSAMFHQMDKDQLETFARDNFNVELDKRRSKSVLFLQVEGLQNGTLTDEDIAAGRFEPVEAEEDEPAESEVPALPEELPDFSTMTTSKITEWQEEYGLGLLIARNLSAEKAAEKVMAAIEARKAESEA